MADAKIDEKNLWKWLSTIQARFGHFLHMERIENITGKGTPDVHGVYNRQAFTIELKAVARGKLIDCEISEHQEYWALRRQSAGGQHWFLIQVGSSHTAARYLIPGWKVSALRGQVEEQLLLDCSYHRQAIRFPEEIIFAIQGNDEK